MKQVGFLAVGLFTTGLVHAQVVDPAKLAADKSCMACHAINNKVLGPSYKDVAAKYKGNATAEAMLVQKVIKGGSGVWGQIPMPPNASLKEDEAKLLVKWVLSQ